ncbi:LOW QUALITY PROTEIN: solute carrier family 12 member 2-like, partial [Hyalella azteca]|uniref:LOW QUALITY PROTEIN: solute carrier family 12 member 2-like n=1 Tax=Hyalella azteca TaxID=294128 RepID=A0A8B7NH92_HYAAZ
MELRSGQGGNDAGEDVQFIQPSHSSVYETKYQKSLRHYLTREALPKESNYRNLESIVDGSERQRPTLDELHDSTYHGHYGDVGSPSDDPEAPDKQKSGRIKFGWLEGVLMRCLLNIWGVMLFLRVSWMVGQAGLGQALAIVCAANTVTVITAISMSAVATNGLIQGGGVYYMISRSLGPEFGGSIGLMFTVANSIAVATYIIGFVNSLQDMLYYDFDETVIIDRDLNDVRAVGTGVLFALMALAIVGMDWVTRVQMGLLFLLIASQIDFIIGAFIGPFDDTSRAQGFLGFSVVPLVVRGALCGAWRPLWCVVSFVDPGSAIPKGTLLAIGITFCTYLLYPVFLAASEFLDFVTNDTGYLAGNKSVLDAPSFTGASCSILGDGVPHPDNLTQCKYGLMNNFQVMELVSAWGPLIYAGCFAATLSSAIASLVGAPRVLQALAKDRLYPGIFMFSKGFGANNDPVNGYCLVFMLSLGCIMIGDLNAVSTLLSNFFLASYSLINFSCFHASIIKSPGWRPAFKYYNHYVSLAGGLMCLVVMFLIDYVTALITFLVTIGLYMFVSYRKPGTLVPACPVPIFVSSPTGTLVPACPVPIFVSSPTGTLVPACPVPIFVSSRVTVDWRQRSALVARHNNWLKRHKIRSFYSLVQSPDLETGALSFFQLVGLSKLKPNMVLLGYKSNWNNCSNDELVAYFNTL